MSHITSEKFLFRTEETLLDAVSVASDALLIALQREHPRIVRHLQDQAAANRQQVQA
jgi:hypothetical protein